MEKITVFSLVWYNKDYLNKPLRKLCLSSWERLVDYFKSRGYDAEIKIYTEEDQDFKDFMKFNLPICGRPAQLTDAFRVYILSKYKYHLWLDLDVYVSEMPNCNNLHFNFDNIYFKNNWCIMYNANNTDYFKKLLQGYINLDFYRINEKDKHKFWLNDTATYNEFIKVNPLPNEITENYRRDNNLIHLL